jgi:DNA-binding CsgD family transcriptional regulator
MSTPLSVLTNGAPSSDLAAHGGRPSEQGLLLMDMSLRPIAFDRGAAALLDSSPGFAIPLEVQKAIRDSSRGDLGDFRWRFRRGTREYTCRAFLVKSQSGSLPSELLVLYWERDWSPADSLSELSAEFQLTSREQEVLRGIAMGLTGKELADRLNISPGTVKSFIRMIMIKLGVRTRGAILAKLLKYNDNA